MLCVFVCLPRPASLHTFLSLLIQVSWAAQALVTVASGAALTVRMAWLTSLGLSVKETCGTLVHTGTVCGYTIQAVCQQRKGIAGFAVSTFNGSNMRIANYLKV